MLKLGSLILKPIVRCIWPDAYAWGAVDVGGSLATLVGADGLGALPPGYLMFRGADNFSSGIEEAFTGRSAPTLTARLTTRVENDLHMSVGARFQGATTAMLVGGGARNLFHGGVHFSKMGFAAGAEDNDAKNLADKLADSLDIKHTTTKKGIGHSLEIPHGNRNIVVRIMQKGGKRTSYYRVSVDGKETFAKSGKVSTDRALTHMKIEPGSHEDILKIIGEIKNESYKSPFSR